MHYIQPVKCIDLTPQLLTLPCYPCPTSPAMSQAGAPGLSKCMLFTDVV